KFIIFWDVFPSQADIEEAPEETRKLYKEYKMLKQQGKTSDSSGKTGSQEIPNVEQVKDSGFWGSHLNRAPKIPGKSQSRSARPGISAEFYGMKLKAKVGTIGKEPPLTPRRTPNPRRIPKIPQSQKTPERGAESSPAEPSQNEGKSENPEKSGDSEEFEDLVLPPLVPGLGPLKLPTGINPSLTSIPEKFQQLKQRVAQTLGSLDPGWIQRCQESPKKREFPAGSATEKEEIQPQSVGNSVRKRPREGGGATEAPAKLRRSLQGSDPGIFGMRQIQKENEDEGEWLESQNGAGKAPDRLEKILEKEEKPKPTRRTRVQPRNGGNFVLLNLKRKTYSRGNLRGKFLRKRIWKQKWRKKFGAGSDLCFRCGGKGHWASECPGKDLGSFQEEIPEEEEEALPTLEEVARRTNGVFIPDGSSSSENSQVTPNSQDFLQPEFSPPSPPPPTVDPLYPPNPDGTIPDPPEEVLEALRILGYNSFRPGQAEAIMRVLSGISTLVVLPTGMGKSLCYQLPAFLYHRHSGSISLVISPLVSLMDDQVSGLPSALKAVCIHSNLSQSQREAAMEKVRSGKAQILLLSPESLVGSGSFSRFFRDFPPVAFACLDEAHCVSQWSHNFRPAYLRICKVLRERFGVRCFLGLTATATAATARDVAQHLGIPPENGIGAAGIPENLRLSVSVDSDRDQGQDLLELRRHIHENSVDFLTVKILIQRVFAPCKCLEIHGKNQENSKEISEFPKNSRICRGHERSIPIQELVETLDLREEAIQTLLCLLELHPEKFLELFPPLRSRCRIRIPGNSAAALREAARGPGIPAFPAAIQTLLCLLELHPEKFLELFPPLRSRCRIRIPGNSAAVLREAARGCPPLGFLLAQDPSGSLGISGFLEFDAVALSDSMGWEFRRLRQSLRRIPWESRKAGKSCGIQVEFQEFSFFFRAYGDLDGRELDSLCQFLNSRALEREKSELRRLRSCFRAFQSARAGKVGAEEAPELLQSIPEEEEEEEEQNSRLRERLREYFQGDPEGCEEEEEEKNPGIPADEEEEIRAEIRKLLAAFPDEEFTGRAVARIFHGIGSPRFPSRIFGRDRRFWRRLLPLEFRSLSRLASQEILASR
ncbi:ATP-dependent DNA helicase Q4-like, partial [Cyanistes caeruleus]|uniref:ATP-dependent DNA helicase Q4-like n=1 Tax=Cyanistes caeruleus TaxID=156563 RepID=UPI000CDAEEDD